MSVTAEIAASYRHPRRVIRRRLAEGPREDRALAMLMAVCGLIFLAQWPRLARETHLTGAVPLDAALGGALLGWVFLAPLLFYGLAAISRLMARLLGGRGSGFGARLALFWSLFAVSPLWLLHGLAAGVLGPGILLDGLGLVALAAFLTLWAVALFEVEFGAGAVA